MDGEEAVVTFVSGSASSSLLSSSSPPACGSGGSFGRPCWARASSAPTHHGLHRTRQTGFAGASRTHQRQQQPLGPHKPHRRSTRHRHHGDGRLLLLCVVLRGLGLVLLLGVGVLLWGWGGDGSTKLAVQREEVGVAHPLDLRGPLHVVEHVGHTGEPGLSLLWCQNEAIRMQLSGDTQGETYA